MKIKICGITNADDARLAESLGADFVGFIFVESSPRCVGVEQASSIARGLTHAKPVGVFVDTGPDQIEEIACRVGLHAIQIYEQPSRPLCGVECIRAIRVKDRESLSVMKSTCTDYFLLDSCVASAVGGTGVTFDWAVLPDDLSRVFLSGGINPENARQACKLKPFALDVCSGVEQRPGVKDPEKMRRFVNMVRT